MRWLRLGLGRRQVEHDTGRQHELLDDVRRRFGAHVPGRFAEQADAVAPLLDDDDGLAVAAAILREFADEAHAELSAQAAELSAQAAELSAQAAELSAQAAELSAQAADLQRRTGRMFRVHRWNYRPLWQEAGPELRWPLFALPGHLHPYVQVNAAATVVGGQARRVVKVTDPGPLLTHLFEILDLTLVGWEYGRVRVDVDAATLAERLIVGARDLRDAMGDPPPLPPPVRELMRRNNTIDVYDPDENRTVGAFNPGARMRECLLA